VMMRIIILLLVSVCFMGSVNADSIYKNYDWEKEAKLMEIPLESKDEPQIILKQAHISEFAYDEERLTEYYIFHEVVHVNSDDAIEDQNKKYLPVGSDVVVLEQKARVVTPDGKNIEMMEDDINEALNEDGSTYTYFALRGLVVGSQVEYFYIIQKARPGVSGKVINLQGELPRYNISVDIYSPENLIFASKSFNGLEDLVQRDHDDYSHLSGSWESIPSLRNENNAFYVPNVKKLIYKLDKNYASNTYNIISYNEIATDIFKAVDVIPEKKEKKLIKKLLKEIDIDKRASLDVKLNTIESYMKRTYPVLENYSPELEEISDILANKMANHRGIVKIYCALLNTLEIDHQVVLTSDRDKMKFDKEFEAYSFLQNYLIYIDDLDKFVAPTATFTKAGIVPSLWVNNYGLFLKPRKTGSLRTVSTEVKWIEAPPYSASRDDMYVDVRTSDKWKSLDIDYAKSSTGYYAASVQPYYDFVPVDAIKDINESQIKFLTEDIDIESMEAVNTSFEDFGMKPYEFNSKFSTKAFMERAGDKILFKIGDLIGAQVEMYQEEDRVLPVENGFNRHYHREITVQIPDGFSVSNLETLEINEVYEEKGETQMQFISNYTFENGIVKVVVDEWYNKIIWPAELFNEYRRVINAAADFNKVVLYIEKE